MFVSNINDIKGIPVNMDSVKNVTKHILVGPEQGWDGWVMRMFTLDNQGYSPRHSHPWPHINYFIGGKGTLFLDGKEYPVETGSTAFVPSNLEHQFINNGEEALQFICIVPEEGEK